MIGRKSDGYCISFESFAYINLGYTDYKELGPAEIVYVTPEGVETVGAPGRRDEDLFFPVGLLRISDLLL